MPLFPGGGTTLDSVSVMDRPIRLTGPEGPWHRFAKAFREHGVAMVHARLADWVPEDLDDPGLALALGRDYARFRDMRHRPVRERFAASRSLLHWVAGQAMDAPPETVEIAYKPGGRPYLRGCDQIDISLSHTDELLLVGITRRGWIGVDAELSDRPMLSPGIERQVCTAYERAMLADVEEDDRNHEMVRLWTLKEAYSKAIGQGLRFRFNEFGFGPAGRPLQVLRPDGSPGTGDEWVLDSCTIDGRYTVSWALYDAGFGDTEDTRASTMLDPGLLEALMDGAGA
ncbi:4'-phosphopantetheinyl transferase family protein [Streptacidiphilus anmyonensis]|uniref:4'-phosphopantetheinyl transferase family protein n=1 Tax=Streptacidiphilus anmyonensis TaxID=405782 RepID=UPI0006933B14|nr:4'-phosphopantetheinyl transferase superfamily protein [Streptacidiphilus anmyonensis]